METARPLTPLEFYRALLELEDTSHEQIVAGGITIPIDEFFAGRASLGEQAWFERNKSKLEEEMRAALHEPELKTLPVAGLRVYRDTFERFIVRKELEIVSPTYVSVPLRDYLLVTHASTGASFRIGLTSVTYDRAPEGLRSTFSYSSLIQRRPNRRRT